jgi:hypothetical protein
VSYINRYVDLLLGEFKHYKTRLAHGEIRKEVMVGSEFWKAPPLIPKNQKFPPQICPFFFFFFALWLTDLLIGIANELIQPVIFFLDNHRLSSPVPCLYSYAVPPSRVFLFIFQESCSDIRSRSSNQMASPLSVNKEWSELNCKV